MSNTISRVRPVFRGFFKRTEDNLIKASVWTMVVVHFFGVLGIVSPARDWFLSFTWLNLLLTGVLLLANYSKLNLKVLLAFFTVCFIGFMMEALGVYTGEIFGSYYYGEALGYKAFGVPFSIGLNWGALAFSAVFVVRPLKIHWAFKAMVGGAIPVFVDLFIEPICHKLDFWYWEGGFAPIENYVVWYLLSTLFVAFLQRVTLQGDNHFAKFHIGITTAFFVLLNLAMAALGQ